MKKQRMWLTVLIAGLAIGCGGPNSKIERAVTLALAPENPAEVSAILKSQQGVTNEEARKKLGAHNFTSFVLTTKGLDQNYAWELAPVRPDALARYLSDHSTAVAKKDISNLQWTQQPDGTYSGSLSVNTSYGLKATLLFVAREQNGSLAVTKLAVAKKQSTNLADGFTVFEK